MSIPSPEIFALIAGTVVLLILAVGIILIIVFQQRRLFAIQQKNLEVLGESEQRYRKLVKFSPFPMAVFISNTIVYVNDAGARLLGVMSPEELLEKPITNFVHPNFYDHAKKRVKQLLEQKKEIAVVEEKLIRNDGQIIDIEVTAIPIVYSSEDAIQVLVRDITERKRQEAELIAAKERAEQSDKLKDAFIANISHEIRTPLNVILGYSTLIMTEFTDRMQPEEEQFFDSIERGGQRLMRTVEHILNISSIQVGTFELKPEFLDLNARVEKLILDMKSFADEKELTLEAIRDCEDATILADRYCIDQALTNLIDNAIKFTNRGSVSIRVYTQDRRVAVEVKDTGIGISAEYLPKVFSVFSQEVQGYTRPFEGLGLGLALTKRYIELNQGSVTVKSRKGQGTTFTLRFLAAESPDTPQQEFKLAEMELEYKPKPNLPFIEGMRTILVVEDDEQTQEYMRILLKKNYNIMLSASGKEAWNVLNTMAVDLILMDLSLQGNEDGLQLTRRIRQDESLARIPIIALTAHAFPEDRQRSMDAGCNMYFSKPFQIDELRNAVTSLLH